MAVDGIGGHPTYGTESRPKLAKPELLPLSTRMTPTGFELQFEDPNTTETRYALYWKPEGCKDDPRCVGYAYFDAGHVGPSSGTQAIHVEAESPYQDEGSYELWIAAIAGPTYKGYRWTESARIGLTVCEDHPEGSAGRRPTAYDFCYSGPRELPNVLDGQLRVRTVPQLREALCSAKHVAKGKHRPNWFEDNAVTVYVDDDVTLDLSGEHDIPLYEGVTLMSGRGGLEQGALLFTDTRVHEVNFQALFRVRGPYVRVSGLRLRGPWSQTQRLDLTIPGIQVLSGHRFLMIDNNEFYHWSDAAVYLSGYYKNPVKKSGETYEDLLPELGPGVFVSTMSKNNAHDIFITRNYMHHNVREGRGYGVVLYWGAYAQIEANTFKNNRHVASGGQPRTGYLAFDNFVYEDGEKYGFWGNYEHHFDMHGIGDHSGGANDGGIGGEYVEIAYNTIRGDQRYGIKVRAALDLRGRPQEGVRFHRNALAHSRRGHAVRESWRDHEGCSDNSDSPYCQLAVDYFYNLHDINTTNEIVRNVDGRGEVLDFDGDGVADYFQATGAGWYYESGGETEWRFLRRAPERIAELTLEDRNGDGTTDVVRSDGYVSWGGVSDWEPL